MQNLVEFVKTLGAAAHCRDGRRHLALIGFFAFLILRVTAPEMTPLFTDLTLEDSGAIAKELDREGVAYEIARTTATSSWCRATGSRGCA